MFWETQARAAAGNPKLDFFRANLRGPLWGGAFDAPLFGSGFQAGIFRGSGVGPVGRILREYDDCLVLCHGFGKTMGGGPALFGRAQAAFMGAQEGHSKSSGKLPDPGGAEGIPEGVKIRAKGIWKFPYAFLPIFNEKI